MTDAFASVHTFTARIDTGTAAVLADYISPNLVRLRLLDEEAVLVGDRTYAHSPQGWREVLNYRDGLLLRDLALQPRIVPEWARMGQAISVNTARRNGASEHLYRYVSYVKGTELVTTIAVVDSSNLPDYAFYDTEGHRTAVTYLSFNGPPAFRWPPQ
jgi:hypothetical protein